MQLPLRQCAMLITGQQCMAEYRRWDKRLCHANRMLSLRTPSEHCCIRSELALQQDTMFFPVYLGSTCLPRRHQPRHLMLSCPPSREDPTSMPEAAA